MAAYKIKLRAGAEKQLAALDKPIRHRIAAAIEALGDDPRPQGAITDPVVTNADAHRTGAASQSSPRWDHA